MLRVVYLEPDDARASRVQAALHHDGPPTRVTNEAEFCAALRDQEPDVVLIGGVSDAAAVSAATAARALVPGAAMVAISNAAQPPPVDAHDVVRTDELWRLIPAMRRILANGVAVVDPLDDYHRGLERFVSYSVALADVRSRADLTGLLRGAVHDLVGADAVALTTTVADGLGLLHAGDHSVATALPAAALGPASDFARRTVVLQDVPHNPALAPLLGPTTQTAVFVALRIKPAFAVFWHTPHRPTSGELALLQALAHLVSITLSNVDLIEGFERRVRRRTLALSHANEELEAFNHAVAHDLRSPALNVVGFSDALLHVPALPAEAHDFAERIARSARLLNGRIEALLALSRAIPTELLATPCDLAPLAREIADAYIDAAPDRAIHFVIETLPPARVDRRAALVVLDNLIGNAVKFSAKRAQAEIVLGYDPDKHAYFVRDNGAGFDPARADEMFRPFRRLHAARDFAGTGIGLATVRRALHRHGGRAWAVGAVDDGATVFFALPQTD